ncbi:cobalt ECF transporter T component CbiQ [Oscillatoria sp. FACHB-1407]|uniref:cobalt ECF transporter T component CbiQ n=1 Tax=Oscillatoria sp. FACHB-1407 TaxID=2692847 RepID=UPI00168444FC|nr:cobalt ECF transporter T component CbiQ [Oscillatoria sp. FACHB-1407]MBD2463690.1 cobalt ECF transporter T component CbiQ [Oscillatoria sp. FACHB-1407]
MHHHLDVYTYTNHLRHISPQQKLCFVIAVLLIALMVHPILQLLIAAWLGVWTVGYARIPAKIYGNAMMVAGLFLLTSIPALMISIVSVEQIATGQLDPMAGVTLGNWYLFISRSGLLQAMQIGARSLACTSCLLFVLFTIPFTDLLQVLRQWRVPTLITELLLLMYRFVFLFLEVVAELQLAQRSRGGYRTRKRWMYSVGLVVSQLLVRSLQQYHYFSLALMARGFNGNFQVYSDQSYIYSKRYAIESLVGCIGLVILDFRF